MDHDADSADRYDSADDADKSDDADEAPAAPRKSKGGAVTVLGAAMIAVGDILEPEKTSVEIVQTDDDPEPDSPFTLSFGDLPPLD
jgi:hypothetical protein